MTIDTFEGVQDRIDSFAPRVKKPVLVVEIAGASGAGRTELAARLQRGQGDDRAVVWHQDWYQLGDDFDGLDASPYRYDDPDNFQLARCARDLEQLRSGKPVSVPQFTLQALRSEGERLFRPRRVVIADGLYAMGSKELRRLGGLLVYTEAPLHARMLRRLFRLTQQDGIDNPQAAIRHALGPTLRAHRDFGRKQRNHAHAVITADYSFAETVGRFGLQPISGESATNELWAGGDLQLFLDREAADTDRLSIVWKGELYRQIVTGVRERKLLQKEAANLEEL